MFQTPTPDLGALRRLLLAAAVVSLVVAALLSLTYGPRFGLTLGDTDDAMRLSMVRDLLHGRGWYDQNIARLQPPLGAYMHWSRLVDGGIAGLTVLLGPVLGAGAEAGARFLWPMLWIWPAVVSTLLLARRLGGGAAVLPTAVLLAVGLPLYAQFAPGRIDHHGVMLALTLVAAAGASEGGVLAAALSAAAMALDLAVGLEALLFCAAIAGAMALRFAFDAGARRATLAFGVTLAVASGAVFLIQTPPGRWGLAVCDAMGVNLALGLCVGGAGLALAAMACGKTATAPRVLAVLGAGAAALVAYLAPDIRCAGGPMAEIDPRLWGFWFAHIQELASWPQLYATRPDQVVVCVLTALLSLGALGAALVDPVRRGDFAWRLVGACLALAAALDASAARMESYLLWMAVPVLAAALTALSAARFKQGLVPTLALALLVSATPMNALAQALYARKTMGQAAQNRADHCDDTTAFARLAHLPPGLVLSEIDLGPAILAQTPHAVLNAPYHRMVWGVLSAQAALTAPADLARAKLRALRVDYVAACPAHAGLYTHVHAPPYSLVRALDHGAAPAWLTPLSDPDEALQLYRVS